MRHPRRFLDSPPAQVSPDPPAMEPLDFRRLASAKSAYTTRFLSRLIERDPHGYGLVSDDLTVPRAGDVVLARVLELGQHVRIERPDSRKASLFEGDEILVAYGNRYAPDQFEAEVPADLGPAHMVAAGGAAGRVAAARPRGGAARRTGRDGGPDPAASGRARAVGQAAAVWAHDRSSDLPDANADLGHGLSGGVSMPCR